MIIHSTDKENMLATLPGYYEDIIEVNGILDAEARLLSIFNADMDDLLNQFTIDKATWGLDRWEWLVGLPGANEQSMTFDALEADGTRWGDLEGKRWRDIGITFVRSYEERRAAIKSKLQGYGTITAAKIKEICNLYTSGTVDVSVNSANFTVTVTFTDILGIPPNYDTLVKVLNEVIPAHLLLDVRLRWMTWRELDAANRTWNSLDGMLITWDEFSEGGAL